MKAQQIHNYTKGFLYRIACKENTGLVTTGMKAYWLPYGTMISSTEEPQKHHWHTVCIPFTCLEWFSVLFLFFVWAPSHA